MDNRKFYTCCFSGHRPNNLPWKYNENGIRFSMFKQKLKKAIKKAIESGYIYFISGMALGVDIICAEIIIELKKREYPYIQLECAIPCINQTQKWLKESVYRYNSIITKADKTTYVSKTSYYNGCMQKRNNYMINNSNMLIAVFSGKDGGTKQTIEYATSKGVVVKILKP